ncbi:MAG: RecQ family ATP-dependent DNA helicase [Bacteroidetes bacterium]|nr:RecQ family ATP-dependent DNA helicase [Bacteroidota bacterium]
MSSPTATQLLKKYWGHSQFRSLQEEIIQSVIAKKDTLALLPTGGGKSICFQIPALMQEGICIVVSPLIALMKDQVHNLTRRGIKAEAIYSGMKYRQIDTVLDNCVYGNVKFLYVSPERLETEDFKVRVQKMKVCLLAVDEAHCISQWGYDFRPPYLNIAALRAVLNNVPVIALTATATPQVVDDIQEKLQFGKRNVFRKSFVRNNLSYVVRKTINKEKSLLDILSKVQGTAVVYVRNRKLTKQYADLLNKHKIKSDYYHAGLDTSVRSQKQEAWINNKTRVICCTNAFGMGIDKADVRLVVHTDLAESIEAYFQEAGRAGRDEKRAYAVQLTDEEDAKNIQHRMKHGYPEIVFLKEVYDELYKQCRIAYHDGAHQTFPFDIGAFAVPRKLQVSNVLAALKILQQHQLIYLNETPFDTSEVKIICSKNLLFDFMEKHKAYEPILKMMLRTMEGLFEDYVYVEEWLLAHRLEIAEKKVFELLAGLHKLKIVDYKKLIEKPQITFLQDRVPVDNLRLDIAFLNKRKKDFQEKLEALYTYITNERTCRTKMLVEYFGEHNAAACGVCDICLAEKKAGLNTQQFSDGVEAIKHLLKEKPQTAEYVLSMTKMPQQTAREILDFMLSNGSITKTKEGQLQLQM